MQVSNSTIQMRHLASFVVVAEELHFTRAATRLHVAQQTLSQQIRQLELSLGVPLLDRSTRRVQLTDAGAAFYKRCIEILAAFEAAHTEAQRADSGDGGSLRLAYTPSYANQVTELRNKVLKQRPGIRFSLVECWSEQALSGTLSGTYQAAMIHRHHELTGLVSQEAGATEVGVVLGANDPLAARASVNFECLRDRTLTLWPREFSPHMFESITAMFRSHFDRGQVYEFETFARGLFLDDERAPDMILHQQAFTPAVAHQVRPHDALFVWRPMSTPARMPAQLAYRADAASDNSTLRALLAAAADLWPVEVPEAWAH